MKLEVRKVILISVLLIVSSYFATYFIGFFVKDNLPALDWDFGVSIKENRVFIYDSPENVGNSLWMLNNFDSNYYLGIAKNGYDKEFYREGIGMKNWAFYPMYPLTVSVISKLLEVSSDLGLFRIGLVISNTCLSVFLVVLYFLLKELEYGLEDWLFVLIFIFVFPTSYFLNIFYTESMFLAFSSLSLLMTVRRKYFLSSLFILLSSLTRNVGLLLFVPMSIMLLSDRNVGMGLKFLKMFLYGLISSVGVLIFFTYIYYLTGDFFSSIKVQSAWGRGDSTSLFPFQSIFLSLSSFFNGSLSNSINGIDLLFSLLGVFSLIFLIYKTKKDIRKIAMSAYFLVYMAFVTSTSLNTSIIRFIMAAIPVYLVPLELKKINKQLPVFIGMFFVILHVLFLTFFVLRIPSSGV